MNSEKSWAELEIERACNREKEMCEHDYTYVCGCYESALKAYKSLEEDGHSGLSISFTKMILDRLIEHLPITPLEDLEEDWELVDEYNDEKSYQHKRYSGLFKTINKDNKIRYNDVNKSYAVDVDNPHASYYNGLINSIITEMFPIKFPYYPIGSIKVFCETFLVDPKNGDYDTKGILYGIAPHGERIEINKFFHEENGEFKEINKEEYNKLKDLCKK